MNIGPWQFPSPAVFLAPMAGVTDRPFRQICRQLGAALAVSEMVTSRPELLHTRKTRSRLNHEGEEKPVSVQILGTDARQMAQAAQFNVQHGADIIDINMGCPAKKVCNISAGSALLRNEQLVGQILSSVSSAVSVPVTLKIRTGWDKHNKNTLNIAKIAEDSGIQALAIHGRTRACAYSGNAEYDMIKLVKQQLSIPVIANGDINSAEKAQYVLQYTNADAIMIGREAIKSPWIFSDINHYLATGTHLPEPALAEKSKIILGLLDELYSFYGSSHGVRIARKHLAQIIKPLSGGDIFWQKINRISNAQQQYSMTQDFLNNCV
ncbi:MAG: tRNA dihydrouridine synthase DusB [gamma proteobacterium symbiont of Taylorina sp.]|nr:tRNA dihydrouridine synthase DusB [gamma proteobacterium symbiont of Taylorina sp.]